MTKAVTYVQKHFLQILLAAVLGYIGWMGIEINSLGKDIATLKANDRHFEKRLDSMTEILMRIDQRMTRIEEISLLNQSGKGSTKSVKAEKP